MIRLLLSTYTHLLLLIRVLTVCWCDVSCEGVLSFRFCCLLCRGLLVYDVIKYSIGTFQKWTVVYEGMVKIFNILEFGECEPKKKQKILLCETIIKFFTIIITIKLLFIEILHFEVCR